MSAITIACIGFGIMLLLIILQIPIAVAMAVVGLVGYGLLADFNSAWTLLSTEMVGKLSSIDSAVIPMFLLMGSLATVAGLSGDIYRFAYTLMGHIRGGLAIATIVGCGFFGAICGSCAATTATFARVALPEMIDRKYSKILASGCICAGGGLGTIVPPSVPLVLYAIVTEQFIVELFMASFIPAFLSIVLFCLAIAIYAYFYPEAAPAGKKESLRRVLETAKQSWAAMILLLTVLGGIYLGVFTVNESAAVGCIMALFFTIMRGKLTKETILMVIKDTVTTSAMIYMIMFGAGVFGYFITVSQLPSTIVELIAEHQMPNWLVLLVLLIMYLIMGSLFDTLAAMLITLPFVIPIILNMDYSLVWWGVVNMVIGNIGQITPPIGINVFVMHGVSGYPLNILYRGVMPFVYANLILLALIVIFPQIVMFLPKLLM